jgi:glycerol-3-phosphate acyltransferase PlsX
MMAIALLEVGREEGVLRPAIAAMMPSKIGTCVVLDVGANTECTPEMLLQFATLGAHHAKVVLGIAEPRVGLLSNGEEASKGTELSRAALALLEQSALHFKGYCEGRDVFEGSLDVVVCDGFSGNVLLKTAEGVAAYFGSLIKKSLAERGLFANAGALLMRGVFSDVKKRVDPREYGAAPLLGLRAPVFIAHGNSDAFAIRRAIFYVRKSYENSI